MVLGRRHHRDALLNLKEREGEEGEEGEEGLQVVGPALDGK